MEIKNRLDKDIFDFSSHKLESIYNTISVGIFRIRMTHTEVELLSVNPAVGEIFDMNGFEEFSDHWSCDGVVDTVVAEDYHLVDEGYRRLWGEDRCRSQSGTRLSGYREELGQRAEFHGWNPGNAVAVSGSDADSGNAGGIGKDPGPAADDDADALGRYEGSDDGVPHLHRDHGEQFGETGWESERGVFQGNLQRGSTYGKMEQEADLDFGNPFGGPGSAGTGAAALVGSLSRLKETSEDPEERKRELEAKRSADNLGVAIGLAIAAAEALREKQSEVEEQTM